MIHIKKPQSALHIFKALSSEVRLEILELLNRHGSLNLNQIAEKLKLTNGAVTTHIKKLEDSGLIEISTAVGKHGIQKRCYLNEERLLIELKTNEPDRLYEVEIKVGHYSDYHAVTTCGLATKDSIIGEFDDPRYFADPQHIDAQIIWLTDGYLEYRIPNYLKSHQRFTEIQFAMEIASEAPAHNNRWPSDIYFHLNDIELGYWTSPGDFGDKRGIYNPSWWPDHLNQYGQLKLIRVNGKGTFIDGCRISDTTIDQINLNDRTDLKFRISTPPEAENPRGLTIFGKYFGNYNQDITVRAIYETMTETDAGATAKPGT